jgi:hypothetical protein
MFIIYPSYDSAKFKLLLDSYPKLLIIFLKEVPKLEIISIFFGLEGFYNKIKNTSIYSPYEDLNLFITSGVFNTGILSNI